MSIQLGAALADCYRTKSRIATPAAAQALDRQGAFAAQAAVAQALGVRAGGWKVAMPDGVSTAAPMFDDVILAGGLRWPLPEGGAIVEIELGVRLTRDLPPRPGQPYTREEIGAAVGNAMVGVELIASRYDDMPPPKHANAWLADNMGNAAYVTGDEKPLSAIGDPATLRCRYWANGELKQDFVGGHPAGDPLLWILHWANAQEDQLGGLKAGQVVTTGSLTVPVLFDQPTRIEAELDRIGRVTVDLV
jgi:2-keto-4-pentenoate hydratase